jgi:hypothetical protein
MEKADQHIAVCCVFIIASATIGGCFSDNKQVNVVFFSDISEIHFHLFG